MNPKPTPRPPRSHWLRSLLAAGLGLVLALAAYAGVTCYESNFHTVVSGELYRSAQMDPGSLASRVQQYSIKSILNLRGSDPGSWYQQEVQTADRLGVRHYDYRLSATKEVSLSQMNEIVRLLRNAPKPLLIHCKAGSDRTGLVAALYRLAISGETPAAANRELTVWYGHFSMTKTAAMDHSYWNFVSNRVAQVTPSTAAPPVASRVP